MLTAASGEAALEVAAAEPGPIDLLVSDVVLGGITGPELAAKLKARLLRPEDPVDVRPRGRRHRARRRLPAQAVRPVRSGAAGAGSPSQKPGRAGPAAGGRCGSPARSRRRARAAAASVSSSATNSAIVGLPSPRAICTIACDLSWSVAAVAQLLDELAVDLEDVERQVLEVVERAEAGAEVVERELAAEVGERCGERAGALDVDDRGGLGDLERSGASGRSARCAPRRR